MKDIAIYGAGGFGRETSLLIQQINQVHDTWNLVGFFDDRVAPGKVIDNLPVFGGLVAINQYPEPIDLVVAIADPAVRQTLVNKIKNPKIHFPVLIHPNANTGAPVNSFGRGCIITAGVILTTGIHLEEFVIVNLSTTIGHDVTVGKCSILMPGCSISGNVKIGEGSMIGTGARILQNLSIGSHCRIGAGAVVTKDISDNKTALGVPALEQ